MALLNKISERILRLILTFFLVCGVLLLLAFGLVYLATLPSSSFPKETYAEFKRILNDSEENSFDLRRINSVDWDEFIVWGPYRNICDLGIKGYEEGGANCSSNVESDCYLLLLDNNELVAQLFIGEQRVHWRLCRRLEGAGRILKSEALIHISSH